MREWQLLVVACPPVREEQGIRMVWKFLGCQGRTAKQNAEKSLHVADMAVRIGLKIE